MNKKFKFGIITVCAVALIAIPIAMLQKSTGSTQAEGGFETEEVTISVAAITAAETAKPEVKPEEIKTEATKNRDINLNSFEEQTEPAKPEHANPNAANPVLTDPAKKPDIPVPPVTQKPAETKPPSGGGNGQINIPGFGWVEDHGGGGQGEKSVGEGDINKIIGQ